MNEVLEKLWKIGVLPEHEDYIKSKIRITNQINSLLIVVVDIPFIIIGILFFWEYNLLLMIPSFGILICIGIFVLNYINGHKLARVILSIAPSGLALIYHAAVVEGYSEPIATTFMVQMSFSLIPFLIFDLRELPYLLAAVLFVTACFFLFDIFNVMLDVGADDYLFRYGILSYSNMCIALLMGFVIISTLLNNNGRILKRTQSLLYDMNLGKTRLEQSETELKANINQLEKAQEEERKRNWANEGLTRFGKLLRNNNDSIELLSERIIGNLVKYLNFSQGALYTVKAQEENPCLELKSCYAYDRQKYLDKFRPLNEGVLGQAVKEKNIIKIYAEIPNNQIPISSGLGESKPRSLLVVPLKLNDEVLGVMELASFSEVFDYQVEFAEKLSESITAALSVVNTNARTKKLLNDAQYMTEQMKEQEEEMRQNMEELQATQEEMERKQRELDRKTKEEKRHYKEQLLAKKEKIETLRKELRDL